MSLSAGTRLGPYEVLSLLGAGGMGEVYRARDGKLNRDVAIKVLTEIFTADPDRVARFTREAQTLAALNHPNIAAIYGVADLPGGHRAAVGTALVMELVEGEDLSAMIARGAIPVPEALPIARQIAAALEAAHEQGIIHRDLKPANVKVRADGTVKVLDFGLAKAMDPAVTSADAMQSPTFTSAAFATGYGGPGTQMGVILGTAAYMAPEQARGKAVDKRADIWAFGVVLYEMLTGQPCFHAAEMADVLAAVLRQPIDWTVLPPDTPPSVRRLLGRCLERDRAERLGDMSGARLEIKDADAPDTRASAPVAPPRQWTSLAAAMSVLAILLAVALGVSAARPPAAPPVDAQVVRFSMLDDKHPTVNYASTQPFAISRDGRTIVFTADSGSGVRLWVRTLDRRDARELAGTEGGYQPAISPDGRWVAFVVANHIIRKVPIEGGAATTLASLADLTAALTWASQDLIIFEKIGSGSGLHRVTANGGSPELLVPFDRAAERLQRRPFVLRDARVLLYASSTQDGRTTLAAFSLDDRRHARLELEGTQALGMIDGDLVYSRRDGSLMTVPFDARAMRVTGTPRQLADRVAATPFGTSVALSESGTLVSAPPVSPASRLVIAAPGAKTSLVGEGARVYDSPRFSPDGRRIAVGITESETQDLWVLDASGAGTRLTRGGANLKLQDWTPDGKALVYIRGDKLWIASVGGSQEPRLLRRIEGRVTGASLMPDGRSVVLTRRIASDGGGVDREELVRAPVDADGALVPILSSSSTGGTMRPADPRVSPDGKWVAFQDRNERQVHVRSIDGAMGAQISDTGGELPVWSRDGRRLLYRSSDGIVGADLQFAPSLGVIRRERLPESAASGILHDISSDGRSFLILAPVEAPKVLITINWAFDVRRQLRAAAGGR